MIIAKNTLFPKTKVSGNTGYKFVVFTSEHGHYSVEKAAILLGLGSAAVRSVPVDEEGRMVVPGILPFQHGHHSFASQLGGSN